MTKSFIIAIISASFVALNAYGVELSIRVLISEDAPNANVYKSQESGLTWLDGRPYAGEIVFEKSAAGKLAAINIVPLEKYVEGIISGEMPSGWPIEALKAQAVAARTYAHYIHTEKRLVRQEPFFDVRSTVEDQVYGGAVYGDAERAATETSGEVLMFRGEPVKARFHSVCGGETETSLHVWGENDAHKSIRDPYCAASPHSRWRTTLTSKEIETTLASHGFALGPVAEMRAEKFESGGRVAAVSIHGKNQTISLTSNDLRRYIGFERIKSTFFTIARTKAGFVFSGRGFGHGVGMCQWGAKAMAEKGYLYRDILNFYYPNTETKKIY